MTKTIDEIVTELNNTERSAAEVCLIKQRHQSLFLSSAKSFFNSSNVSWQDLEKLWQSCSLGDCFLINLILSNLPEEEQFRFFMGCKIDFSTHSYQNFNPNYYDALQYPEHPRALKELSIFSHEHIEPFARIAANINDPIRINIPALTLEEEKNLFLQTPFINLKIEANTVTKSNLPWADRVVHASIAKFFNSLQDFTEEELASIKENWTQAEPFEIRLMAYIIALNKSKYIVSFLKGAQFKFCDNHSLYNQFLLGTERKAQLSQYKYSGGFVQNLLYGDEHNISTSHHYTWLQLENEACVPQYGPFGCSKNSKNNPIIISQTDVNRAKLAVAKLYADALLYRPNKDSYAQANEQTLLNIDYLVKVYYLAAYAEQSCNNLEEILSTIKGRIASVLRENPGSLETYITLLNASIQAGDNLLPTLVSPLDNFPREPEWKGVKTFLILNVLVIIAAITAALLMNPASLIIAPIALVIIVSLGAILWGANLLNNSLYNQEFVKSDNQARINANSFFSSTKTSNASTPTMVATPSSYNG